MPNESKGTVTVPDDMLREEARDAAEGLLHLFGVEKDRGRITLQDESLPGGRNNLLVVLDDIPMRAAGAMLGREGADHVVLQRIFFRALLARLVERLNGQRIYIPMGIHTVINGRRADMRQTSEADAEPVAPKVVKVTVDVNVPEGVKVEFATRTG